MNDAWNDIMSTAPDPDPEKLMAYLEGRLGPEERHELERQLAEGGFTDEALEGLGMVKDPSRLPDITAALDEELRKKIRKQRKARASRPMVFQLPLPVWLTIVLLVLVVLAFVVLRLKTHGAH